MAFRRLYLLHPQNRFLPGIMTWVEEIRATLAQDADWVGREIISREYDIENSFRVIDIVSQVIQVPGPVILVEKVQSRARELLRQHLRSRSVVVVTPCADSTDLYEAVQTARVRFESGEPFLPRKLVVAILLLQKLERGHYWGGNAKRYMYQADLAKARGVDEKFANITPQVANDLLLKDVLIKKPSGGKVKYALNPDRKAEIYAIIERREFLNGDLERVLLKDKEEVSARELDE